MLIPSPGYPLIGQVGMVQSSTGTQFSLDVRKHFFTERMFIPRSRFSRQVVNGPSLTVFKRHLNNALDNML